MNYWLVKTEPETFSWDDFVKKGGDLWDGVRNYQARNNMKMMKEGDLVLFYHSGKTKEVVGLAKVTKEYYQDPTTEDKNWVVVDLEPVSKLDNPVSLSSIKTNEKLEGLPLIKNSRLSVMPVENSYYEEILKMSK